MKNVSSERIGGLCSQFAVGLGVGVRPYCFRISMGHSNDSAEQNLSRFKKGHQKAVSQKWNFEASAHTDFPQGSPVSSCPMPTRPDTVTDSHPRWHTVNNNTSTSKDKSKMFYKRLHIHKKDDK
jgi:hypothetical protein